MRTDGVAFQLTWRDVKIVTAVLIAVAALLLATAPLYGQKAQDNFGDKFKVNDEHGTDVAVATSADGRFVYVAGRKGVLVSDDFGRTGSWTQTLRMK